MIYLVHITEVGKMMKLIPHKYGNLMLVKVVSELLHIIHILMTLLSLTAVACNLELALL
jgi:hypothetical protein